MKVARTVYSSRGDVLLKVNTTVTTGYINKLIKLGVPYVYVEGGMLPDIEVKEVIAKETRVAAVEQVKNILLMSKEAGHLVIEPKPLYFTVSEFTEQLMNNKSLAYNLADLRTQDDYTFAHSVNVSVLAIMTGITLGLGKDDLTILGVGGMLHDLGKVRVPYEILNKKGPLTGEEFAVIKEHTTWGFEMIRYVDGLGDSPAYIAYQHHECYDGSGYPLGISGSEFRLFSQITAIADKFDALTADRIYRPAFPAHEAFEMCAASGNLWFKDNVVRAFLYNIAAYPTGTLVELSNGMMGVAVDTPKGFSLFPRVRVIAEKEGRTVTPYEVTLHDRTDLRVVKTWKEEEYYLKVRPSG